VFAANLVGCFIFALYIAKGGVLHADVVDALFELCRHLMENTPVEMFAKGILAGWLIAAMVWMLPSSDGASSFFVVVLATYLIALGDFTHVVAGSAEVLFLVINGEVAIGEFVWAFLAPTFFGNVVGGTALFALLTFGQVHDEIETARD
jgi:formate/nitrite transporter FocA (FNT family)